MVEKKLANNLRFLCILVLVGFLGTFADEKYDGISSEERFVLKYMEAASKLTTEDRYRYSSEDGQFQTLIDIGQDASFPINCTAECHDPQSVHELYPADIDVVAAIGDSVTAASGIDAIFIIGSLTQYRGSSWSIGGDGSIIGNSTVPPIVTIPNIINYFKDKSTCAGPTNFVKGYSEGKGRESADNARLNQAVIGATAEDLFGQAEALIQRINDAGPRNPDPGMQFNSRQAWKLLTIFIGGNDMCDYCNDRERYSPTNYGKNIKRVLDLLKDEVSRVYVSIVPMFGITPLKKVSKGQSCDVFQRVICSCAVDDEVKAEMDQVAKDYHQELIDLIGTGDYETDDFAVVLQSSLADFAPLENPITGEVDKSIFAPDCFHPSRKGHELFAYLYWNTMIKWPVGIKPTWYPIYNELERCNSTGDCYKYACPEPGQYLWTFTNSNGTSDQFNVTTTTRRTTSTTATTTTVAPLNEEEEDTTAWIAIGSVIGVVGILTTCAIVYLFFKERKDDEESFFA